MGYDGIPSEFENKKSVLVPSKIEWDLTNGPLRRLLELLNTQVFLGPFSGSDRWRFLGLVHFVSSNWI